MHARTDSLSLRRKLLIRLLVPLIPLLLIGMGVAFYMSFRFVNQAYNRSLFRATLSLADQVTVVNGQVTVDLPQAAFDMLEYDRDDWIYYKVTGPSGEFVTGYPDLPPPNVPDPVAGQRYYYSAMYDGNKISVAAFYLSLEGTSLKGMVLVQVAETTAKREHVIEELIFSMVIPQLLMVILATLMVRYGVISGLAPLEKLRQQISERSHRDLSPLDIADSPREVQPILGAMNGLIARLEQVIAQQQRFVADASHQLRTPLAGIRTQAEIALQENDPQQVRHALQLIETGSGNLTHLLSQLLSLARLEPNVASALQFEQIDLVALAREMTSHWVPAALAKRIDLGFESAIETRAELSGNPVLLRELLSNLLDNAIRYTQENGKITVRLLEAEDHFDLTVEDNGPGIPAEQRERVFERFYRILGSNEQGCGLGLSIVREIATRHDASVTLEGTPTGRGTLVRVRFRR